MHIFEKITPDSLQDFLWIKHEHPVNIGPFRFPADLPIPIAAESNIFALDLWLDVPYRGRSPIPTGHDEDEERLELSQVINAYLAGHIPATAPDSVRLADQVGRCMLIIAYFDRTNKYYDQIIRTFTTITEPVNFFDILIRQGLNNLQEGSFLLQQGLKEESSRHFVQAMLIYYGAHILAPASSIVPFNLAVLCYDLSKRREFQTFPKWESELLIECRHYLHIAMADPEIRESTPAYYLLAGCRELIGDQQGALTAYKKFLKIKAADKFPDLIQDASSRLSELTE